MLDTVARDGLVLLGCGKMGTALLTGWLAAGVPAASVWVIEPNPTDWLKASDEDMQLLGWRDVHWDNTDALATQWHALGCQRVALTFGATGAALHFAAPQAEATVSSSAKAAPPTVNVVDTVGAGDTFWGSCLADWVLHDTVGNDALAASRAEQTLQRALKAAAINCERVGCQPPSRQEI